MYEQSVLLRIRRSFSKDESVAQLLKMLSEKEYEIGLLKSDLAEAKHKLCQPKNTKKEWLKDDLIHNLEERASHYRKLYDNSMKSVGEWRDKYISLKINGK